LSKPMEAFQLFIPNGRWLRKNHDRKAKVFFQGSLRWNNKS